MVAATWIVGGGAEAAEPAVVAVVAQAPFCGGDEQIYCTGTLIAPRAVLTAAHCVDVAPPGGVVVVSGPDARDPAAPRVAVVASFVADGDDVALLALAAPLTAPFASLRTAPLDGALVGTSVRVVGYGKDEGGLVGVKRAGDATIEEVAPRVFRIVPGPALSCNGDSGGPVFLGAELAGVTSFGDAECVSSGTNARIDVLVDTFVTPTLAAVAAVPEGDGTPLAPGEDLCARACDQDHDCPADFTCVDDPTAGARRCGYLGMAPGRLGGACEALGPGDATCVPDPAGVGCLTYTACELDGGGGGGSGCRVTAGTAAGRPRPAWTMLLLAAAALAVRRRMR